MDRISPRRQGDLGELSAMEWLRLKGYAVFYPIGHSPDCDLIVDHGRALGRVQVKTTTRWRNRRWEVMLCTRGGNPSWNGAVKHFSSTRCDRLFVAVADGRRWFMAAAAVSGVSLIVLGGPKYAEYEVKPGRPLASERA